MGKDKKKHSKKSSKHKKHKSSKCKSSSDDSSSSENEWVEAPASSAVTLPQPQEKEEKEKINVRSEREDWISSPALFACISREEIRTDRGKEKNKNETDKYILDKLGQTDRELNPYWKDGGSGLPENTTDCLRQASVTVGDQGAAWLRKALQRAKEQAVAQGRPLEQVVAERWGSLEQLENMITIAEGRDKKSNSCSNETKYQNRHGQEEQSNERLDYKNMGQKQRNKSKNYHDDSQNKKKKVGNYERSDSYSSDSDENCKRTSSKNKKYAIDFTRKTKYFTKPHNNSDNSSEENKKTHSKRGKTSLEHSTKRRTASTESSDNSEKQIHSKYKQGKCGKNRKSNKGFAKPSESSSENEGNSYSREHKFDMGCDLKVEKHRSKEGKRSFVKPHYESEDDSSASKLERFGLEGRNSYSSSRKGWKKTTDLKNVQREAKCKQNLMQVASEKLEESKTEKPHVSVKEPLLTDKEMNELGAKLVKAELLGNQELVDQLKAKLEKAREAKTTGQSKSEVAEEVVILTHTDSKGFTRPVSLEGIMEPTGGRRKARKVETHSGGKRTRYFADDDKYSLQEMFQREKLSTVEDSNEVFAKLASKGVGHDDSARDMDDVFEETACIEESMGRKQAKDRQQAIEHSKRTARSLENCQWCLESHHMLKHLIIAIGKTCYLCVPPYQSLTETHCLIVPSYHTPCGTQLDEDVWREMQDFRRSLVQMFQSQDEDVVFFESARYLTRLPHMILNCVPMPKEVGDLAPIYFKKAIQECEMEWSNNKKLVDLRGRDIRRAVPKGLPYFAVDFGMDSGFAHVIEDEKLFPNNFAQEIIGGMLDLDHTIWRKQRRQTFEEQSKKVIHLSKLWAPFDITKKS